MFIFDSGLKQSKSKKKKVYKWKSNDVNSRKNIFGLSFISEKELFRFMGMNLF